MVYGNGGGDGGPFAPYRATGGQISGKADAIMNRFDAVRTVSTETRADHVHVLGSVEGMLLAPAANAAAVLAVTNSAVDNQATYAAACVRNFGDRVDEYNETKSSTPRAVRILNSEYAALASSTFGVNPVRYPLGASDAERGELDSDREAAIDGEREKAQNSLRDEYQQSQQWIEDRGNEIAARLDRGPNESDILALWQAGAMPSWANVVYPSINFNKVQIDKLPYDLRSLSEEELERIADDVAVKTLRAYIEAEIEFATWEIEGKAEATYKVMAGGKVVMNLMLEGGLGREISVGDGAVDASGGLTTDLELTFDSVPEAEAFLEGLRDEAVKLGVFDVGNVPAAVAENVASYVMEGDNISGFKVGAYGRLSGEFENRFADGEAEARLDAAYDIVKREYSAKLAASVDGAIGGADSGYSGKAKLEGEVLLDENRDFKSLTLMGVMSGAVANQKLGLDIPNTSTGQGVDVQLKVTRGDRGYVEIEDAFKSGDVERAAELAMANGRVVARQTTVETFASAEKDYDVGIAGAEVEYGASAEAANNIWLRQPGTNYALEINSETVEGR